MGSYELIRQAIVDRRQVVATYGGHRRELCPHVIGTKDGRAQVLLFQFGGSSRTGGPSGGDWRCIPVDGLEAIEVREGPWITGANYDPRRQSCIDVIDAEVSP